MGGSTCSFLCLGARKEVPPPPPRADPHSHSIVAATATRPFTFDELAAATSNFRDDFRIVRKEILYKGYLRNDNQVVAIKLQHAVDPDTSSEQLNKEFLARVLTLSSLRHPNVVDLVGFCADGITGYLFTNQSPGKALLDWNTRMNIAAGVAKGLEYLHHKGLVYRNSMSSSDILLGDGYHPKLSQYGLADLQWLVPNEGNSQWANVSNGIVAPETISTGSVTVKSNMYSFGGLLLEMITGRRAFHRAQDPHPVTWATQLMETSQFRRMADPALQDRYPSMDLQEALKVASMCIHQQPSMRPPIGTVVAALSHLAAYDHHPPESSHHAPPR